MVGPAVESFEYLITTYMQPMNIMNFVKYPFLKYLFCFLKGNCKFSDENTNFWKVPLSINSENNGRFILNINWLLIA